MGWDCISGNDKKQNCEKGLKYCLKAANKKLSVAEWYVCHCNLYGIGVKKNLLAAINRFGKAAAKGFARDQLELGICHLNGWGVLKSTYLAKKCFIKAANQGNKDAIKQLIGVCSFCDSHDNTELWKRCSDNSSGYCVEHDVSSYEFNNDIFPVIYSDDRDPYLFMPIVAGFVKMSDENELNVF